MTTEVLSPLTLRILETRLKVNDVKDTIDWDFNELSLSNDVNREKVEIYSQRNRGSVRLARGLFRTVSEQNSFFEKVKRMVLP
jgi:hypothetical protein